MFIYDHEVKACVHLYDILCLPYEQEFNVYMKTNEVNMNENYENIPRTFLKASENHIYIFVIRING